MFQLQVDIEKKASVLLLLALIPKLSDVTACVQVDVAKTAEVFRSSLPGDTKVSLHVNALTTLPLRHQYGVNCSTLSLWTVLCARIAQCTQNTRYLVQKCEIWELPEN